MLIKICGLKKREDLAACIELGVEAFGLMFVPGSARYVGLEMAAGLSQQARGKIQRVGVFQDATAETVQAVLAEVELDVLQFHGSESAAYCASFGMPYVKVIAVRAGDSIDVDNAITQHQSSCGLLLDTASGEGSGGTGQTFDWSAWPSDSARRGDLPLYLAGGLTPDNVARAIALTQPAGVDVSGGVEGAQRGVKNPDRIAAFVTAVRAAASALG